MRKSFTLLGTVVLFIQAAAAQDGVTSSGERDRAQPTVTVAYDRGVNAALNGDLVEAQKWYRLAAEQGHARAQFAVGLGYNNGVGVPQNNAEAMKWYRRSADQGHPAAQFFLGLMYWGGEGVPRDFVQAYMWFNRAAACALCEAYPDANGASQNAAESRERVARDMTAAQIADAQKMANEWKPKPER